MYDDQATDVIRDTGRGASLVYARWGIAPLVAILAAAATAADRATGAEPVLLGVSQIGATGPHNAFTDLVRYRDRWFCVYREGAGHAEGAGRIRVLSATDDRWETTAVVETAGVDLRDPKLSIAPDGRLMMLGGAAEPATRNPVKDHYSFVSFSDDGRVWSKPERVLGSWQWLWRVTWHKGMAYGVAYEWDPKSSSRDHKAALYKSRDGLHYEKLADFEPPGATEATLRFGPDETLYCLQRRDGKQNSAMLGTARPPYTKWEWKDLGMSLGGPNFIRLPDGVWWAAGRARVSGKVQTVLARLDVDAGTLTTAVVLPSGGDTSYPGLVWHDDVLWMSYYSSHEGQTRVYLARTGWQ